MPTYAILGATGGTGSAVLRHLAARPAPNFTIHLLVRSEKKLHSLHPFVRDKPNIIIFEGAVDNSAVLAKCLRGVRFIFSCIALNESVPGQSVALDTAKAIVAALHTLQQENSMGYRPPTVVMLSAGAINPQFSKGIPIVFRYILETALFHAYDDLRCAEEFYLSAAQNEFLNVIFAQPPAIMAGDIPSGYELSTTRANKVVSYADLGAGMVEMAERGDEFLGKGVTVIATGDVKEDWGPNLKALVNGLLARFLGIWRVGKRRG